MGVGTIVGEGGVAVIVIVPGIVVSVGVLVGVLTNVGCMVGVLVAVDSAVGVFVIVDGAVGVLVIVDNVVGVVVAVGDTGGVIVVVGVSVTKVDIVVVGEAVAVGDVVGMVVTVRDGVDVLGGTGDAVGVLVVVGDAIGEWVAVDDRVGTVVAVGPWPVTAVLEGGPFDAIVAVGGSVGGVTVGRTLGLLAVGDVTCGVVTPFDGEFGSLVAEGEIVAVGCAVGRMEGELPPAETTVGVGFTGTFDGDGKLTGGYCVDADVGRSLMLATDSEGVGVADAVSRGTGFAAWAVATIGK